MSLDSLAPDQRAVVQLVLQQDRSYDDLAALLGITPDAVRERAHRGLERLAPGGGVDAPDRAEISDYLLGQQSVSGREATRSLLQRSEDGRQWALAVAEQLADVARSPLPEVPAGAAAAEAAEPDRAPLTSFDDEPETVVDEPTPATADPEPAAAASPTRARPRPRREAAPVPDFGFDEAEADEDRDRGADAVGGGGNRTSRLGGALLLAGIAIAVAAVIIALVSGGNDSDSGDEAEATPTPSATATGTATAANGDYTPIGYLNLRGTDGQAARGRFIVYASQDRQIAFNVLASKVPATPEGTAYGVWLTGGGANRFLGFAPPVGENGQLRVSGPRQRDQANFANWFTKAKQIVVSRETQEGATAPGPVLMTGTVKALKAAPTATPTAAP